eukprot:TRINITY_DN21260_c0_g1_i1.p1 TRINITY_DN21260_c0_g1~~TRINITY_DN21260_c0_g1_i1.p1  ORF type:complete len:117 (+),score=4.30 TRINITY_DN21260_c0_g1_i1:27-377(+)
MHRSIPLVVGSARSLLLEAIVLLDSFTRLMDLRAAQSTLSDRDRQQRQSAHFSIYAKSEAQRVLGTAWHLACPDAYILLMLAVIPTSDPRSCVGCNATSHQFWIARLSLAYQAALR